MSLGTEKKKVRHDRERIIGRKRSSARAYAQNPYDTWGGLKIRAVLAKVHRIDV